MPNLVMDLCFGQLGYPYHANRDRHLRMTYKARATQMFTDVFILDQARYLYDLVPSIALMRDELPDSIQLFMRVCMDAIRRHAHSPSDPFVASALAGFSEAGFSTYEFAARETANVG